MPTGKETISKDELVKQLKAYSNTKLRQAKEHYDKKLKRWFLIGFVVLGVVGVAILFFVNKKVESGIEALKIQQDSLKIKSELQRQQVIKDSLRNDSLKQEFNRKQPIRETIIIQSQKQRDERINQIRNPSFSGNDDSIRAAFSKH